MRHSKIVGIIVLSVLLFVTVLSTLKDFFIAPVFYLVNLLILLSFIIRLLFKKKKTVVLNGDNLFVKSQNRIIRKYNLALMERVIYGYQTMKIVFKDSTETLRYSDFEESSIKTLYSLSPS